MIPVGLAFINMLCTHHELPKFHFLSRSDKIWSLSQLHNWPRFCARNVTFRYRPYWDPSYTGTIVVCILIWRYIILFEYSCTESHIGRKSQNFPFFSGRHKIFSEKVSLNRVPPNVSIWKENFSGKSLPKAGTPERLPDSIRKDNFSGKSLPKAGTPERLGPSSILGITMGRRAPETIYHHRTYADFHDLL